MKKIKKLAIWFLTIITALLLFAICVGAFGPTVPLDFGDFGGGGDYGGGGDGGGGGGGGTGGGGIDFGGGNNNNNNNYTDDDYDDDPMMFVYGSGIVVIIVIAYFLINRKNAHKNSSLPGGAVPTTVYKPMQDYQTIDPNFSNDALCSKVSNMYVKLQNSWQSKNLDDVRIYMTDEFFGQTDRQLDSYRNSNTTNKIERIAVLGVTLKGYDQNDVNDMIYARLNTRVTDYVVDDKTGDIIRGSDKAEKFMEYEWTLVRTKGKQTSTEEQTESIHCPSCGAPLNINKTAKCEYCGAVVSTNDYDWVISAIKGISQRTVNL